MRLSQRSAAVFKQHQPVQKRRKTTYRIKPSMIAVYSSVFILIVALISIGYHQPEDTSSVANAAKVTSTTQSEQTSVDNAVATSVASGIAQATNLPVAKSVANLAVSAQIQSELSQSDGVSTIKPQIIESVTESRLVSSYTVVAGDTIETLAKKFNISAQTIKWANNLTTDAITVGNALKILPVDGVLYAVKSDDTIDSIATKYAVDKTRLVVYNDLDVSGIKENTSIILPSANLPTEERPGYIAPVAPVVVTYYSGYGAGFGGNTWFIHYGTNDNGLYAHGNCTLYAYNRRMELGLPVGAHWGNASSWDEGARQDGLVVNRIPSVGAIIQNDGYLGHVAIVESISANGDLSVSEMNAYVSGGGYNIVSGRTVIAGNVGQYNYIH